MGLFEIDIQPNNKLTKSTDWKWSFADYPKESNGLKVFTCFACGGGSSMGYKLAGCDVVGCCEIDKKMNEVYVENHHPKYNYLMDIRDFNNIPNEELPDELFNLDILDGSPPCSSFSLSGEREAGWGKEKKFREGQAEQTLDDLFFVFIDTIAKLRPKVSIMENVDAIMSGNAYKYVLRIYQKLEHIGYSVKHWLLKGEEMGVPQTRHRVFFIAVRNDIDFDIDTLNMEFKYAPIPYGEIKSGEEQASSGMLSELAKICKENETMCDVAERLYHKHMAYNHLVVRDNLVFPTQLAAHGNLWTPNGNHPSIEDLIHSQTFPEDFNFIKRSWSNVSYVCGMSVPPIMIKRVVDRLIESGIFEK